MSMQRLYEVQLHLSTRTCPRRNLDRANPTFRGTKALRHSVDSLFTRKSNSLCRGWLGNCEFERMLAGIDIHSSH